MRKIVNLPIEKHIHKFVAASVEHDFLEDIFEYRKVDYLNKKIWCLTIINYLPKVSRNKREPLAWISTIPPENAWISIEMIDPDIERLFSVRNYLHKIFYRKMRIEMEKSLAISNNARQGLKNFLDMCDISELDFKQDTGYKHWQRYQKKLKKKKEQYATQQTDWR